MKKRLNIFVVLLAFTLSAAAGNRLTEGVAFALENEPGMAGEKIGLTGISKPAAIAGNIKLRPPVDRFQFGASGGVHSTFGNLRPTGYYVNPSVGFNIGVYVRVYLFENLFIQPSVNYYYTAYDFRRNIDDSKDKVKVHSMRIPVTAGYSIVNTDKFFFRLQTGPSVGFNLKVADNDLDVNKSNFKKTYWDWIVDAQMRIAVLTIQGGFVGGMSKYLGNTRSHSWYCGLGFSI
jgi:hypothetical protein